ncbi:MAG: serine--tRNA ligase [bacterium]|nr:serine--tRNA ligase [bacterium]
MLDIKFIRQNRKEVEESLKNKGVQVNLGRLLEVDEKRREKIKAVDELRAGHNRDSDDIMKLKGEERETRIKEVKEMKAKLADVEFELKALEEEFRDLMYKLPNVPFTEVPVGKDGGDNITLREVGKKPKFDFAFLDYIELGEKLDLIDTARASKVSGSRFGYLKHEAPILELALLQFAMSFLVDEANIRAIIEEKGLKIKAKPFIPVIPPVLVRPEAMRAMGYMERGEDEIYHLEKDDLYLVGTSEQSVGPMHQNEIFEEETMPHRHIAFSTCFRREAGSYGKDTRGILRVHQFDKAEMFVFSTPETSKDEHQLLLGIEEKLMSLLGIPYRVLDICTGDLGDPAAAKYDIEAWLPGQNEKKGEYRETHSTSNTTDFQARRLNIKYRDSKTKKSGYVHMLNGTAFAMGRMLIAILENYQQSDGSVRVPEILQPYTFGIKEIKR